MITIWHNPRCSKSRQANTLLEENGIKADVYKYLDENLSVEDIKEVLQKLGMNARELMRTKEDVYKTLRLKDIDDETALIEAMVAHPKLIERPIVIKENRAVIARPAEKVIDFLKG